METRSCTNRSCCSTPFGFTVGDLAGWSHEDDEVPRGSHGQVVDFDAGNVGVTFTYGEFLFAPCDLYRVGDSGKYSFDPPSLRSVESSTANGDKER